MDHTDALKRLRDLFRRGGDAAPMPTELGSPTLLDQEPDLAREAARYTLAASAWAAGHSTE